MNIGASMLKSEAIRVKSPIVINPKSGVLVNTLFRELVKSLKYVFVYDQASFNDTHVKSINNLLTASVIVLENISRDGYHAYVVPGKLPFVDTILSGYYEGLGKDGIKLETEVVPNPHQGVIDRLVTGHPNSQPKKDVILTITTSVKE